MTKKNIIKIISYVVPGFALIVLFLFIRANVWKLIDADFASDMVLAGRLNEEHSILAHTFYYSTELRILYFTLVYQLLLKISASWHFVRVYSGLIMYLIMLISAFCMMRRTGREKYFPVFGTLLILPLSWVYFKYTLLGYSYIPYIVISFVGFAFILHYPEDGLRRYTRPVLIVLSGILSMLACMVGLRQIVVFYLPLLLAAALVYCLEVIGDHTQWRSAQSFGFMLLAVTDMAGALVGYMINVLILSERYHFKDWTYLAFTRFDPARMIDTLFGMTVVLGYKVERLSVSSLISNGSALLLMILTVAALWYGIRHRHQVSRAYLYLSAYVACGMVVFALVYSMSDMYYWDLYSIPVVVFFFPLLLVAADEVIPDVRVRVSAIGVILGIVCVSALFNYREYRWKDDNAELREIATYLDENGYTEGYASFWNGNPLTEFTDGDLDVWVWTEGTHDINNISEWLQVSEHIDTVPSGKLFVVYADSEKSFCDWTVGLTDDDLIYKTPSYSVYGYPSYEDMMEKYAVEDTSAAEDTAATD